MGARICLRVPAEGPYEGDLVSLPAHTVRFGTFQLDLRAAELRQNGSKIKLPEQPFQILCELVEHPGEVVTREDLRQRLWQSDTFVDFEHGLNTAVKRLRELLGDSAENPRYIETLPRHGYRLMVPVERIKPEIPPAFTSRRVIWLSLAAVLVISIAAGLIWRERLLQRFRPVKIESLAVLPLENLSGDPTQEYFSDGMTEELITELGKVRALRVISRHSVMRYKGTNKTVPQIAKELNVDALVEGSAMRSGGKVRITAQLIQANPERHLWSESYERDLRDIIALQREVSQAIVGEIQVKMTPRQGARPAKALPLNPEAYEAYLKGRYYTSRFDYHAALRAVTSLQEAIQLSPDYAPAYAALADAYFMLAQPLTPLGPNQSAESRQYFSQSEAAARKALSLDDSLAGAHARLGDIILFRDWNWTVAQAETQRALELDPNCLHALYAQAIQLTMIGRHEASRQFMRRALDLDPLNAVTGTLASELLLYAHRYDEAEAQARRVLELEPTHARAHGMLAWVHELRGQGEEAANEYGRSGLLSSQEAASLARAFRGAGMHGYYSWLLKLLQRRQVTLPIHFAHVYAGLNDRERTLHYIEAALQQQDGDLLFCKVFPWFDPLHSDPRFQDLLHRIGIPD